MDFPNQYNCQFKYPLGFIAKHSIVSQALLGMCYSFWHSFAYVEDLMALALRC